jgi:hypothetical protein
MQPALFEARSGRDTESILDPKSRARELLIQQPELGSKIAQATGANSSDCEVGLQETLKFLILAHESQDHACTPSRRVDLVWHEFILFTRLYAKFCDTHFGRFIHHEPAALGQSCSVPYQHTLKLYRKKFGALHSDWWDSVRDDAADCGMCDTMREIH